MMFRVGIRKPEPRRQKAAAARRGRGSRRATARREPVAESLPLRHFPPGKMAQSSKHKQVSTVDPEPKTSLVSVA